jgi:hypothetical protein
VLAICVKATVGHDGDVQRRCLLGCDITPLRSSPRHLAKRLIRRTLGL